MTNTRANEEATELPDFAAPPVVEVSLGIQFKALVGLRPIDLGSLRDRWRAAYPIVQEHPPLTPAIEQPQVAATAIQLVIGPGSVTRLWFLTEDQTGLIQVQPDRLNLNWRQTTDVDAYPRYPAVRAEFAARAAELEGFVRDHQLGEIQVRQAEVSYINAVDVPGDHLGAIDRLLRHWQPVTGHHLGQPEQARVSMVFDVPGMGQGPVRMYVNVDPAQRPDGRSALFMGLTMRGAPVGEDLASAISFMDSCRQHLVRAFTELTPDTMHAEWGRSQ